ncbi:MAG: cardiolipin synthase [Pantoea sp. Brub]|nr:cardiolipin synthase [Pantoea sp. Brub]
MIIFYKIINLFFLLIYLLLISVIVLRILIVKRRSINSVISWFSIIYIFPILGIIAYLSFGELYLGKRRTKRVHATYLTLAKYLNDFKQLKKFFVAEYSNVAYSLFQLCKQRQGIPGIKGNYLKLLSNTDKIMISLINDIKNAHQNIEIIFYTWHPGGLADKVAESLIEASRRGVNCRLMLDSAGSTSFFRSPWVAIMRSAGINIIEALKVKLLGIFLRRMDVRQHRKLVLIDNYTAYIGSMNLVDPRFFKQSAGVGQWIDLMVRIQGPISAIIGIIFSCDWEIETGNHIPPTINPQLMRLYKHNNKCAVNVIASGPEFLEDIMHQILLTSIYSARKQLIITTPYFVPSDDLLHAICTTALRGVNVKIIIPRHNDSFLVKWASRVFFNELLKAGVKIYQFKGGLLHTKSILVDRQLTLLGTFNLDMRSLWLNFEITLIVDDSNFSNNMYYLQKKYIANSILLDQALWLKRSWWKRIVERIFYFFSPLL